MEELFREPAWMRSFNETASRINQISQLQDMLNQQNRLLEYSSLFEMATESIRILEAARPMLEMQDRLKNILGNQQLLQSIDQASKLQKYLSDNAGFMRAAQETTRWYNDNAMLFRSIETLMPVISDAPLMRSIADAQSSLTEMVRGFDFSSISYGEETLIYDGQEYTSAELSVELNNEISLVETHKTFPEKLAELKNKLWLIFIIIQLLYNAPDVEEKVKYYTEKIETVISIFSSQVVYEDVFAYVIRDSAVLRETADSKSPQIVRLLYDTKLRVISEMPRWVQVEYIDGEGNSFIGWISKISITTENNS
jgi:hypothetical protein